MKQLLKFLFFLGVLLPLISCSQNQKRTLLGKTYAQEQLKVALADGACRDCVIDHKTRLIKDSVTAINMAEPILFSVYGKNNIIQERPYEIYDIDHYWVIGGTLPDGMYGGTFLIIIDAFDGRVIQLVHSK